MDKKYIPSALVLYLNYFIHGIGCSILSQQVVKEMLASQWGLKDVMAVTSIAAALGLGRLISLPFAGPLSDKLGRRLSVIIGCASYVIFLVGIAFSPNTTIAYVAAVLGGIANSFLDTATYPAVTEIIYKYTGIATMGIKFFVSVAQLLMPFFLDVAAGTMVALFVTGALITKFKQVRFLVIYPAISLVMLALVYIIKTPMICYVGAFVIGYAAAGGVLQMAIVMNIVITAIGVLLALFVNLRYDVLLKNTENQ